MSESYFKEVPNIAFEGPASDSPLAYRFYDRSRRVLGKTMEEHLRPAVCYWHTFAWSGSDGIFGQPTFDRPWHRPGDPLERAAEKLHAAFEFFVKLGTPFFTFHDRDVAPEGATLRETNNNLDRILELMHAEMAKTGKKVLWGTANLFSHPRYMAGAATNPDPQVFAYAAAQVLKALESTHRLDGANYVLWGGREGYETLLNTDMKREQAQLARFLAMVAEHKHKIGFKGMLLIEPKPKEPTKHQYDYDTATVHAFLQKHHLEREYKVNIEANHAILAGHTFRHEIAYAIDNGILGSIDMNRGDPLLGWDTDQFPNDPAEVAQVLFVLLRGGGFTTGGMNFDARPRRPSIDPADLFHAHIGGLDTLARGLLMAEKMIDDGKFDAVVKRRYADWDGELGRRILAGKVSLQELAASVMDNDVNPRPRSGQQELLENLANRYL